MLRDHPAYGAIAIAAAVGLQWILVRRWRRAARGEAPRRPHHDSGTSGD
jgi:hypothetical protein